MFKTFDLEKDTCLTSTECVVIHTFYIGSETIKKEGGGFRSPHMFIINVLTTSE